MRCLSKTNVALLPVALALATVTLSCTNAIGAGVPSVGEAAAISPAAGHGAIAGKARVSDGDTLTIDGVRIRLEGIDAPETGQVCNLKWIGAWHCGAVAASALARMVEGRDITCENRGSDKYGRMLGVCFAGPVDINAAMVRAGLAWAFVKYSSAYVKEEQDARAAKIGVWQAETQTAWDYRASRWASAEVKMTEAPHGCVIKGAVTRNGRIYHMPWSPWYDKVRIDDDPVKRGERRWFCTEAEAIAAGWRPAMMR